MLADRQVLRRRLMRRAAQQHGYFTAAQARELGYSYQAQKFHADRKNWERVGRALFRVPEWPVDEDDHLVRWTLWSGGVAVVSHESALAAHGLGDVDPARVHLSVPPGCRRRNDLVAFHRQVIPDSDIEEREGYRVSKPARAIAESAADGLAQELLDGAVDEALEQGSVSRRQLRDVAARLGPRAELGIERGLQAISK